MSTPLLRPIGPADLDAVLTLNNEWVPEVSELDADRLDHILGQSSLALLAVDPAPDAAADELLGLVIVLAPGADYDSPNYRFFEHGTDDGRDAAGFRYVDRIIVAATAHRRGVGRLLYGAVFDHAADESAPRVTCEVNVDPPNPVSLAFHSSLGFAEVGRQSNYGGEVTVAFMSAPVPVDPQR